MEKQRRERIAYKSYSLPSLLFVAPEESEQTTFIKFYAPPLMIPIFY
jgi:hypothetical protein